MAYVNTLTSCLLGEPKVAVHIAALPSVFLMPGIALLSSASGVRSVVHAWADLYISQNAVFPEMGCSAAGLAAWASVFLADSEESGLHEVKTISPTTAAAFK